MYSEGLQLIVIRHRGSELEKAGLLPSRLVGEVLPQEEIGHLGLVYSEGKMECEMTGGSVLPPQSRFRTVMVPKELSGKALPLPVNLCSYSQLWSRTLSNH